MRFWEAALEVGGFLAIALFFAHRFYSQLMKMPILSKISGKQTYYLLVIAASSVLIITAISIYTYAPKNTVTDSDHNVLVKKISDIDIKLNKLMSLLSNTSTQNFNTIDTENLKMYKEYAEAAPNAIRNDLVRLIDNSKSIDSEFDKTYWKATLENMNSDQLAKLYEILNIEKKRLEDIEEKYEAKKEIFQKKYLEKWEKMGVIKK